MAKQIKQFRYYGDGNVNNYPTNLTFENLNDGTAFKEISTITQLGIQTLPGVRFRLNNALSPIIIGSTGIYELDLEGISEITQLMFESISLSNIESNSNAYLIIDMICELKQEA